MVLGSEQLESENLSDVTNEQNVRVVIFMTISLDDHQLVKFNKIPEITKMTLYNAVVYYII